MYVFCFQGPCESNQIEMTRGQFLDAVNSLIDACVIAEENRQQENVHG